MNLSTLAMNRRRLFTVTLTELKLPSESIDLIFAVRAQYRKRFRRYGDPRDEASFLALAV